MYYVEYHSSTVAGEFTCAIYNRRAGQRLEKSLFVLKLLNSIQKPVQSAKCEITEVNNEFITIKYVLAKGMYTLNIEWISDEYGQIPISGCPISIIADPFNYQD